MMIKVNAGKGDTYVNINLEDVAEIVVSQPAEAGQGMVLGGFSFVELKNGKQYLLEAEEAQRIVDFMRKRDDDGVK